MQGVHSRHPAGSDASTNTIDRLAQLADRAEQYLAAIDDSLHKFGPALQLTAAQQDLITSNVMLLGRCPGLTAALREAAAGAYAYEQALSEGIRIGIPIGEQRAAATAAARSKHRRASGTRPAMHIVPGIALAAIPLASWRTHPVVKGAAMVTARTAACMRHHTVATAAAGIVAVTSGAAVAISGTYSLAPYAIAKTPAATRIVVAAPAATVQHTTPSTHPHTHRRGPPVTMPLPAQVHAAPHRSAAPAVSVSPSSLPVLTGQLQAVPGVVRIASYGAVQVEVTETGAAAAVEWTATAAGDLQLSVTAGTAGAAEPGEVTVTAPGGSGVGEVTFSAPGMAPVTVPVTWGPSS